jgi:hypothetical protein
MHAPLLLCVHDDDDSADPMAHARTSRTPGYDRTISVATNVTTSSVGIDENPSCPPGGSVPLSRCSALSQSFSEEAPVDEQKQIRRKLLGVALAGLHGSVSMSSLEVLDE